MARSLPESVDIYYGGASEEQLGPVNFDAFERLVADGSITNSTLVWWDGAGGWTPLRETHLTCANRPPTLAACACRLSCVPLFTLGSRMATCVGSTGWISARRLSAPGVSGASATQHSLTSFNGKTILHAKIKTEFSSFFVLARLLG